MGPASDPQLCTVRNAALFLPRLKQNPTEEYGSYSIESLRVSSLTSSAQLVEDSELLCTVY